MDYAVEKTCCERCLHIVRSVLCVCWNLKTSGVVVLAVSVIVGEDALKLHRKKNTSNRGCRQGLRQKKGVGKLDEGFKDWQPLCFQFKRPASVVYYVCFFFFFLFLFSLIVIVWCRAGGERCQKGAGLSERMDPAETGEHSWAPGSGVGASSHHAGAVRRAEDTCFALTTHWL